MGNVNASQIADFLDSQLFGKNIHLSRINSLSAVTLNSFSFSKNKIVDIDIDCLILVPLDFECNSRKMSYIKVINPRLSFAKAVEKFFMPKINYKIDKTVKIGNDCNIATNISIGAYCVIGNNVTIGKGSIINNNTVIHDDTCIGENCYIKSGTVIGEDGFGFDFEEDGTPVRIPHIGNVVIGNNVEIGAKNTIARATLGTTEIEDNVKLDDQVHIAHNCKIGKNSIITACAEISGSVHVGQNCWIGPNSSIIQKVKIGNNVTIGIGAIITNDIADNKKIMGLEGLDLRSLLKVKKRIEYGL